MKRMIPLLLAAAVLLCGCGARQNREPESTPAETVSASVRETEAPADVVSMYDLRKAMLAQDPSLPEMMSVSSADENAAELFAYLSDVDYAKVAGYYLSYAADGTAYEIAVAALRDEADMEELVNSLKAHLRHRVGLYQNYSALDLEQAKAARVVTCGRYAALIMCREQDAVQQAFESGVK